MWTGDTGRGHSNSPIQAELQVVLTRGNPGIALTTAPLPAMRQGPRPCLCLWVPTGSQIPHSPLLPPKDPTFGVLPDASPVAHLFSWCPAQGDAGRGKRVGDKGSEEHRRPGAPTDSAPHGPHPSPVSQALPVGLGLCQLQQPQALLFPPTLGCGDAGSLLSDGQLAATEFGVRGLLVHLDVSEKLQNSPPQSGIFGWLWSLCHPGSITSGN